MALFARSKIGDTIVGGETIDDDTIDDRDPLISNFGVTVILCLLHLFGRLGEFFRLSRPGFQILDRKTCTENIY